MQDELRAIVEQDRSPRLAVGAEGCLEQLLREQNDVADGPFSPWHLERRPIDGRLLTQRTDEIRPFERNLKSQPLQRRGDGCSDFLIPAECRDQVDLLLKRWDHPAALQPDGSGKQRHW